jgi:hypothetical protein
MESHSYDPPGALWPLSSNGAGSYAKDSGQAVGGHAVAATRSKTCSAESFGSRSGRSSPCANGSPHLQGRRHGYLFESNRHTHYSVRTVQTMIAACAREAGIAKRVYPHLLRHSIATILLDSGYVPIDQVQKFLGHLRLSTTQGP